MSDREIKPLRVANQLFADGDFHAALKSIGEFEQIKGITAESSFQRGRALFKLHEIQAAHTAITYAVEQRGDVRDYQWFLWCLEALNEPAQLQRHLIDIAKRFSQEQEILNLVEKLALSNRIENVLAYIDEQAFNGSMHMMGDRLEKEVQPKVDLIEQKQLLFVSGTPRSGTTALGELLNIHKYICLLTERYAPNRYQPDMFSLRKITEGKNWLFHPHKIKDRALLIDKYSGAKLVGDKRPLFNEAWKLTIEHVSPEHLHVVHITRNPLMVLSSYKARYLNERDDWDRTLAQGALDWNENARFILRMLADPIWAPCFRHIFYEEIFSSQQHIFDVWQWLKLDVTNIDRESLTKFIAKSKPHCNRNIIPDEDVVKAFEEGIDLELASQFGYT